MAGTHHYWLVRYSAVQYSTIQYSTDFSGTSVRDEQRLALVSQSTVASAVERRGAFAVILPTPNEPSRGEKDDRR